MPSTLIEQAHGAAEMETRVTRANDGAPADLDPGWRDQGTDLRSFEFLGKALGTKETQVVWPGIAQGFSVSDAMAPIALEWATECFRKIFYGDFP